MSGIEITDQPEPQETLAIVTLVYNRDPKLLRNFLLTLEHQTVSVPAIVVDSGTDHKAATEELCAAHDFVELIQVPRSPFSMSWGFNVGIKAATTDYIMTIGSCMMLSSNYTETVLLRMCKNGAVTGGVGFLRESADLSDVIADWEKLCGTLNPKLRYGAGSIAAAIGSCFVIHRDGWFKVRGYNEALPFAYADSCLVRRTKLSGITRAAITFEKAQLLHQWHPVSPLVSQLGGSIKQMQETPAVCNPGGWGEL